MKMCFRFKFFFLLTLVFILAFKLLMEDVFVRCRLEIWDSSKKSLTGEVDLAGEIDLFLLLVFLEFFLFFEHIFIFISHNLLFVTQKLSLNWFVCYKLKKKVNLKNVVFLCYKGICVINIRLCVMNLF